jgi:hypothetical protein
VAVVCLVGVDGGLVGVVGAVGGVVGVVNLVCVAGLVGLAVGLVGLAVGLAGVVSGGVGVGSVEPYLVGARLLASEEEVQLLVLVSPPPLLQLVRNYVAVTLKLAVRCVLLSLHLHLTLPHLRLRHYLQQLARKVGLAFAAQAVAGGQLTGPEGYLYLRALHLLLCLVLPRLPTHRYHSIRRYLFLR